MRLITLRLVAVVAVTSALALGGAAAARADTVGDFTVEVTAPATANRGEPITASVLVSNNAASLRLARVCASLSGPGFGLSSACRWAVLTGGQTISLSYSFIIPSFAPAGDYTFALSVGGASDSATITVS